MGAGASYAAGLPDADRVLSHLTLYTQGPYVPVANRSPMKLLGRVSDYLIRFARDAGFRRGDRFPLETQNGRIILLSLARESGVRRGRMDSGMSAIRVLYERSTSQAYEYAKFARTRWSLATL